MIHWLMCSLGMDGVHGKRAVRDTATPGVAGEGKEQWGGRSPLSLYNWNMLQFTNSPTYSGQQRCMNRVGRNSVVVMAKAAGFGKAASTVPKDLQQPRGLPTVTNLEWQRPLEILKYPDPRLRAVNAKVGVFDESLLQLAQEMIKVMYMDDGVGLAAPQVGVNVRLMVFNPYGREKPGNETILVNPEIIGLPGPRITMEEGCLSFPKIYGQIERARDLVVRAQNEKGETISLSLGGEDDQAAWVARIFLHEYDHLQGILFPDRMKADVVESVRAQLVAMEEKYLAAHPGAKIKAVAPPKVAKGFCAK